MRAGGRASGGCWLGQWHLLGSQPPARQSAHPAGRRRRAADGTDLAAVRRRPGRDCCRAGAPRPQRTRRAHGHPETRHRHRHQRARPRSACPPPPPPPAPGAEPPEPPPGSAPAVAASASSYLKYLPAIYSADDFLGRFLLIFETILSPIDHTVGNLHYYFDAQMTPPELLPWLASWLGLALDERWPEEQRRALILAAVELYQWRGTRRGLSEFLRLYTGIPPEITEPGVGRRGVTAADAFKFTVRLRVPDPAQVDRAMVEAIIETEKPAHTGYT